MYIMTHLLEQVVRAMVRYVPFKCQGLAGSLIVKQLYKHKPPSGVVVHLQVWGNE